MALWEGARNQHAASWLNLRVYTERGMKPGWSGLDLPDVTNLEGQSLLS
ncbi:hypothetical protein RSK20926_16922 [Roseobacter sp. SK209-2-6]|nr:hypothetical protein RSK20926_16922 [Roseobacter sp. SK209-2-6]